MRAFFSSQRRRRVRTHTNLELLESRVMLSSTGVSAPVDVANDLSRVLDQSSNGGTAESGFFSASASFAPSDTLTINPVSTSENTGEKPQSKVWQHADQWWAVFPDNSGSVLWRLDGNSWSKVLTLTPNSGTHSDVKVDGDLAHILLYDGTSSQLVSLEFVHGVPNTYQRWSLQPNVVNINLSSGVETATIDIDSTGRMWLASDASNTVEVRYSDLPYVTFSPPITVATGITSDDISAVTALPDGSIGVFWSDQSDKRFGFRRHIDGTNPNQWTANEVPASQSAMNIGDGMADDHLNLAVTSDGTLYAAVKTGYDRSGQPKIALLVRRPNGQWDRLYQVDTSGTRPIVVVNEAVNRLVVAYTSSDSGGNILYRESPLDVISFGPTKTLISGSLNNVSSTKQSLTNEMLFIAGGGGRVHGTLFKFDVAPDPTPEPTINPIANRAVTENSGTTIVNLTGISSGTGAPQPIRISATSSNPGLIPHPVVNYQQGNSTGTLQFTPKPNTTGVTTITVLVEDGGDDLDLNTPGDNLMTTKTFLVQVNELNTPPVVSDQTFQLIRRSDEGDVVGDIAAFDANAGQTLTYTVVSASDDRAFDVNSSTGRITVDRRRSVRQTGTHRLVIRVTDNGNPSLSTEVTITVRVVESITNAPASVQIQKLVNGIDENENRPARVHVANLTVVDDGIGTNNLGLSGTDSSLFEIDGDKLFLKAGAGFDFESKGSLNVNVTVDDPSISGSVDNSTAFSMNIQDVNEAATGLGFQNAVTSIIETLNTSSRTLIANLNVVDDALGTHVFSLSGADADLFEVVGTQLFLKSNVNLDFTSNPQLDVTVSVDDQNVGAAVDATANLSIQVLEDPGDPPPPPPPPPSDNTPPVINNQSFNVARRSSAGTTIGNVIASDPDNGQQLTYSIVGGDDDAIRIDSRTGRLSVRNRRSVRRTGTLQIVVRVTDNGSPNLSREATITVRVV